MNIQEFERDVKSYVIKSKKRNLDTKVSDILLHVEEEWKINAATLSSAELRIVTDSILKAETKILYNEVEEIIAEKERIERKLERARLSLQESKYRIYDAIEEALDTDAKSTLLKLHQIKLQSIDLYDILEEMVEGAVITALEKGTNISESIEEVVKQLAFESLSEGSLNNIRIRKIISTILQSAISVAEATPNREELILRATLKGIRGGLIKAIKGFKKQLMYMPDEAKSILIDDFESIQKELHQTDTLFTQVIHSQSLQNSALTQKMLKQITKDMHYDLEELTRITSETVDLLRDKLGTLKKRALEKSSEVMQSQSAQDAKRMGSQAWGVAKAALDGAIKSAKDAIDKK